MQGTVLAALLLLAIASAPGRAAEPTESPLSAADVAFLCALPPDLKAYSHVSSMPKDPDRLDRAARRVRAIQSRALPPAVTCGGQARELSRGDEFLNGLRFSPDRTIAVVSGGYQRGPLHGQGGDCYFEREGARWAFLGCKSTWVS